MQIIDYFFAPQSPYAYLGHARFAALAKRHGADVRVKPVDMGKVFAVSGGLPVAQRPAQRQAYRLVELRRFAEHLGLPLNLHPQYFPVVGDAGAKMIIAAEQSDGSAAALALAGALGAAVWAGERDIADAATLIALADAQGHEGAKLAAASSSAAVGERYERNTAEAIEAQVFGAPTYVFNGELFWGQDRLDFLERALQRG